MQYFNAKVFPLAVDALAKLRSRALIKSGTDQRLRFMKQNKGYITLLRSEGSGKNKHISLPSKHFLYDSLVASNLYAGTLTGCPSASDCRAAKIVRIPVTSSSNGIGPVPHVRNASTVSFISFS